MAANPQNDNNQHSSNAFRNLSTTGFGGHNVIQNAPNQQFAAFVDPTYAAAQLYGQPSFTPNLINTTAFGAANQNQGLSNLGLGQQFANNFQLLHQQQLQQLQRQLNQQAQQHHGNAQFSTFQ